MEELLSLSEGDAHVHELGETEWFEVVFDYFDYEGHEHPRAALTTISANEQNELMGVVALMQAALQDTSKDITDDELSRYGMAEAHRTRCEGPRSTSL